LNDGRYLTTSTFKIYEIVACIYAQIFHRINQFNDYRIVVNEHEDRILSEFSFLDENFEVVVVSFKNMVIEKTANASCSITAKIYFKKTWNGINSNSTSVDQGITISGLDCRFDFKNTSYSIVFGGLLITVASHLFAKTDEEKNAFIGKAIKKLPHISSSEMRSMNFIQLYKRLFEDTNTDSIIEKVSL
jgi:hypothetical protein